MGPWAEQLVIVRQSNAEVLSSARQEQEWHLFPFLHWYGGNKMMGEFVAVKRREKEKKKSELKKFFFPENKEDKENSEQAWSLQDFTSLFLIYSLQPSLLFCSLTLHELHPAPILR